MNSYMPTKPYNPRRNGQIFRNMHPAKLIQEDTDNLTIQIVMKSLIK